MTCRVGFKNKDGTEYDVLFESPGWTPASAWNIPGWFTPAEAQMIIKAAIRLGPTGVLVEVGTWRGRSAAILSDLLGPGWRLFTFDPYPKSFIGMDASDNDPVAAERQARAELAPRTNVHRWTQPSNPSLLGDWKARVLFLDGEHSADAVELDLRTWLPHMANPGLIFLHDALDARVGEAVQAGALRVLNGTSWERRIAFEAGSLWCFGNPEAPLTP